MTATLSYCTRKSKRSIRFPCIVHLFRKQLIILLKQQLLSVCWVQIFPQHLNINSELIKCFHESWFHEFFFHRILFYYYRAAKLCFLSHNWFYILALFRRKFREKNRKFRIGENMLWARYKTWNEATIFDETTIKLNEPLTLLMLAKKANLNSNEGHGRLVRSNEYVIKFIR